MLNLFKNFRDRKTIRVMSAIAGVILVILLLVVISKLVMSDKDEEFHYPSSQLVEENLPQEETIPHEEEKVVIPPSFEELHADEIYSLAKIIYAESGCVYNESWRQKCAAAGISPADFQQLVGYVVMNRVWQKSFPSSTIEGVFYTSGAYQSESIIRYERGEVTQETLENAVVVLKNYYNNTMPVPRNLVFQAEFPQGTTYMKVGNTYFGLADNLPAK